MAKIKIPTIKTVIGAGTVIEGNIQFEQAMHIDGLIKGNIRGSSDSHTTLIIGRQGEVQGDVYSENLILDGTVKGNVYVCQQLELAQHARVEGSVHYRLLKMATGAAVSGQLVHGQEGQCAAQIKQNLNQKD